MAKLSPAKLSPGEIPPPPPVPQWKECHLKASGNQAHISLDGGSPNPEVRFGSILDIACPQQPDRLKSRSQCDQCHPGGGAAQRIRHLTVDTFAQQEVGLIPTSPWFFFCRGGQFPGRLNAIGAGVYHHGQVVLRPSATRRWGISLRLRPHPHGTTHWDWRDTCAPPSRILPANPRTSGDAGAAVQRAALLRQHVQARQQQQQHDLEQVFALLDEEVTDAADACATAPPVFVVADTRIAEGRPDYYTSIAEAVKAARVNAVINIAAGDVWVRRVP